MEELKYVIEDSTIAELLGVQNFSTDEAAILELVKNAYDANALNLKITFQNDTLRFEDNGIGMNADDIKKHWMHIGKSSKEYEIIDENNKKRIQAGSKGVGRFALSRLGYRVCLKSKKIDSVGVIWKTDWNTSVLDENYDIHTKGTDIEIMHCMKKEHLHPINIIGMMEQMIISLCWICSIKEIRVRLQNSSIER